MKHTYKAICLDLDGTVYRGTEPIQEATDFIARLQLNGIEPYFITNNSSMTREQQQVKLQSFGIRAQLDRIITSAVVTATYCSTNFPNASVQVIGEDGIKEALAREGLTITEENPAVVVMGIDRGVNYAKLATDCIAIREGATFIATNADLVFPSEKGLVPGNGSFVKLMESATGVQPIIIGKPETSMLELIQQQGGYSKDEMVMVGDNYDTDILAGIRFGIDTVHVETGVTSQSVVAAKLQKPTYQYKTFKEWMIN